MKQFLSYALALVTVFAGVASAQAGAPGATKPSPGTSANAVARRNPPPTLSSNPMMRVVRRLTRIQRAGESEYGTQCGIPIGVQTGSYTCPGGNACRSAKGCAATAGGCGYSGGRYRVAGADQSRGISVRRGRASRPIRFSANHLGPEASPDRPQTGGRGVRSAGPEFCCGFARCHV